MSGDDDVELKKDLNAAVQASKDLGPEYESALVDSFLAKLDARVDGQVERRVRRQLAEQSLAEARPARKHEPPPGRSFGALPYVSMVFAVPLSAIGAVNEGLPGLVVSWLGIVGVNVAHAWSQGCGPGIGGLRKRRSRDGDTWED